MQNLMRDLLAFSRAGTRGKDFELVPFDEALRRALLELQVAIRDSRASVTHDEMPTVPGDLSQLVQLLGNLIGNAIKFRSAGTPHVQISAVQGAGHLPGIS